MAIGKLLKSLFWHENKPFAPIIEAPYERGFDKEFRLPNDSKNVIRINQHTPKGFLKK